MKITVTKCSYCSKLIENDKEANRHITEHDAIARLLKQFPEVKDKSCRFANGGWCVQRTGTWFNHYSSEVEQVVRACHSGIGFPAWSYGWYRTIDDSNYLVYGIACRRMNICQTCFREWGQPYYANHCKHTDKCVD